MKKCILNDTVWLIVTIPILVVPIMALILGLQSNNMYCITPFVVTFGIFLMVIVMYFFVWFELILFVEDGIKSVKLYKCTKILYSETVRMKDLLKYRVGSTTLVQVLEIYDSNGKCINILVSDKKRQKLIEEIKLKVPNVEVYISKPEDREYLFQRKKRRDS